MRVNSQSREDAHSLAFFSPSFQVFTLQIGNADIKCMQKNSTLPNSKSFFNGMWLLIRISMESMFELFATFIVTSIMCVHTQYDASLRNCKVKKIVLRIKEKTFDS